MLEHLQRRVAQLLAGVHIVTLATVGPAGLQASRLLCEASGVELYLLIPRASDHLFNLESNPQVVIVNDLWNLKGVARVLAEPDCALDRVLTRLPETGWSQVVWIHPRHLTILYASAGSPIETIEME